MVVALSGFADNFYGDHLWSWHAFVTSLPLAFVYLVATVTLVRVQSGAYRCDLVSAPCFVTIGLGGGYRGCLVCNCVGNGGVWVSHHTRATVSADVWAVGDAVTCIAGLFVWFSIRCVTNNCAYFALKNGGRNNCEPPNFSGNNVVFIHSFLCGFWLYGY